MNRIKEFFRRHKSLVLYALFGGVTTVVNFISFKLCNVLLGDEWYLVSNVIAWLISVIAAYIVNKLWVFESRSWHLRQTLYEIGTFFSARLLSLGVEELGLFLLVDVAGMSGVTTALLGLTFSGEMVSKFFISFFVVAINYFFRKLVVFKHK